MFIKGSRQILILAIVPWPLIRNDQLDQRERTLVLPLTHTLGRTRALATALSHFVIQLEAPSTAMKLSRRSMQLTARTAYLIHPHETFHNSSAHGHVSGVPISA